MAAVPERIGVYQLLESIGRGGMGEVYRARDTKLKRDVAIKVLPSSVADDRERLSRFQREAEVLASLNHPHIAAIYGLEESDGVKALVLELVDGGTLADRIGRGPIPIDETIGLGRQIAEALATAHDSGVVHRDLKPSNIGVTRGGRLKILDFGLAKAIEPARISQAGPEAHPSLSPTVTSSAITGAGMILGTAAYMSPEQARGLPVDRGADIWAFGCVLYEMLTGRRAFEGEDVSVILAAVIKGEPNWAALPRDTPAAVRRLLRRCLTKEPRARLRDAADAVLELNDTFEEAPVSAPRRYGPGPVVVAGAATLVSLGLLAVAIAHWREPETVPPSAARFNLARPPELRTVNRPILSRDGRSLAFVGSGPEGNSVFVRSMDSGATRRLANTERAAAAFAPFWSPDSREIAFMADQRLWRVQLEDGRRLSISDPPGVPGTLSGGDWAPDGNVIFGAGGRIWLVRPGSNTPQELLRNGSGQVFRDPFFLPDGRHFVFTSRGATIDTAAAVRGPAGAYVSALDGSEAKLIVPSALAATYAGGYLLYARPERGGMAPVVQAFDLRALSVAGEPIPLDESGGYVSGTADRLAYLRGEITKVQLTMFDRTGRRVGVAGQPETIQTFALSRDGRVVVSRGEIVTSQNLWLLDLQSGGMSPLTTGDFSDNDPRWSADLKEIAVSSNRASGRAPYRVSIAGGSPQPLMPWDRGLFALDDWSSTGVLLYHIAGESALFARQPDGEEVEAARVLTGIIDQGRFSPDGRFIAFNSSESGQHNVSVVPFPPTGERWTIAGGGVQPVWSADGKELFYLTLDAKLMAVRVPQSRTFSLSEPPRQLFQTDLSASSNIEEYAAHADGRFLMSVPVGDRTTPFTVITDWRSLLSDSR